jgi:hypothetical protein
MLSKFITLAALVAAACATACTPEQIAAHGLAGKRQAVLYSRLEDNSNGTFGIYTEQIGQGGYLCTVPSEVVYPQGVPKRHTNNKLFARCLGKRDDTTPLAFRQYCPCVGNTCDDGADCIDAGCPNGCGCVYEENPDGGDLSCGCA